MLPTWFKEYLSYHKAERRAIIFLVVVLFGLIGFNIYQRFFWQDDWQEIRLKYGAQIIEFEEESKRKYTEGESAQPWLPEKKSLFNFDPNTLDSTGWVALGFSPKQTAAIIKYRSAGFVFRKPEDVKKLFVVDEEKYAELQPFIQIAEVPKPTYPNRYENKSQDAKPKWEKPEYKEIVVELNAADSATLVKVKGIGPFFARVIIEHRNKLGGYRNKNQILEVFGMDSAKFSLIENSLLIDTTLCVQININSATIKELVHHPYINFNQAKAIVNYRQQHGLFKSLTELEKIHLVKGETYRKIAPYLKVP